MPMNVCFFFWKHEWSDIGYFIFQYQTYVKDTTLNFHATTQMWKNLNFLFYLHNQSHLNFEFWPLLIHKKNCVWSESQCGLVRISLQWTLSSKDLHVCAIKQQMTIGNLGRISTERNSIHFHPIRLDVTCRSTGDSGIFLLQLSAGNKGNCFYLICMENYKASCCLPSGYSANNEVQIWKLLSNLGGSDINNWNNEVHLRLKSHSKWKIPMY